MEPWQVLKLAHVLAVISALGANLTYQFWLSRAASEPAQLVFVMDAIRRLDRRVANPSYIVAAITGVAVVLTGPYRFATAWIEGAIALYLIVAVLGIAVYAPAFRAQLELARGAPDSTEYGISAARSQRIGMVVLGLTLLIVALMVLKPALWAP